MYSNSISTYKHTSIKTQHVNFESFNKLLFLFFSCQFYMGRPGTNQNGKNVGKSAAMDVPHEKRSNSQEDHAGKR